MNISDNHDFEHYYYLFGNVGDCHFKCDKQQFTHGKHGSVCEITPSAISGHSFFARVERSDRGCYHYYPAVKCRERVARFYENGRKVKMTFCPEDCTQSECHGEVAKHNPFISCFLTNGTAISFTSHLSGWQSSHNFFHNVRWLDQGEMDGISVFLLACHPFFAVGPLCDLIQAYTKPYVQTKSETIKKTGFKKTCTGRAL